MGTLITIIIVGIIIYALFSKNDYSAEDVGKLILIAIGVLLLIGWGLFQIATFI